jgi:hypothetical protein
MLTTNQKGAIAELAIAREALKLGIGVYAPYGDERTDLIFDLHPRLVRVQCKWASRKDDIVVVRLYAARRTAEGLRRTFYTPDEIDAFAAYCAETERCYFFDISTLTARVSVQLRLQPARNNQSSGVRWARDYEFGATLTPLLGP